ncbi:histidine-type phosphatase [Dyella sp. 2HG41-7]|uniref:histidine-type phosphatase n=1 Tax=Dyella sp. 2HG41-7 TaxID=2883239 RepID=UPI001F3218C1|nr:histidine-type phosphatase [Dyella sp. 2HG41-7]
MKNRFRVGRLCSMLMLAWLPAFVLHAEAASSQGELRLVIVLSRHGVRSPTSEPARLNVYSRDAWPVWPVPPGYLTPRGKQLMTIMGRWYRTHYAQAGLLPATGCMASSLDVVADDEQRTMESARGLMDGFDPQCAVTISAAPRKGADALFAHDVSGVSDAIRTQAQAALLGRIGGDVTRMTTANAGLIEQMQGVLMDCAPGQCSAGKTPGKKWLMDQPASVEPGEGDELLTIKSPLRSASTLAEDFYLEYVEGMPMSSVAWGRVAPTQLGQLLALHSIYTDTTLHTPVAARAYASLLAIRVLATLQQAADSMQNANAVGGVHTKIVFLIGHDTNIETLAGLLKLHWLLPEQPADPTSVGGALVFELRYHRDGNRYEVSAYYVSQSMQQMRASAVLDVAHAPLTAPIFIPGCSTSVPGYPCSLSQFATALTQAVRPN